MDKDNIMWLLEQLAHRPTKLNLLYGNWSNKHILQQD